MKKKLNIEINDSLKKRLYGEYFKKSKVFRGSVNFCQFVKQEIKNFK